MSKRWWVLGVLVMGAVGQWGCSTEAEADQLNSTAALEGEVPPGELPPVGDFCGGFAAIQCPEGQRCVDDPRDTCFPQQGDADCSGVCIPGAGGGEKPRCDYKDPTKQYVSRDPAECPAIFFVCPEGSTPFFNDCGCGCQVP
jgi:hypothetical protein